MHVVQHKPHITIRSGITTSKRSWGRPVLNIVGLANDVNKQDEANESAENLNKSIKPEHQCWELNIHVHYSLGPDSRVKNQARFNNKELFSK